MPAIHLIAPYTPVIKDATSYLSNTGFKTTSGHWNSKRAIHASPHVLTTGAVHILTRFSGFTKGRDWRGLQNQEVKMKLVTKFELAAKSENELRKLLREAFNELAKSKFGSHERRNALASIENIQNEITEKYSRSFSP